MKASIFEIKRFAVHDGDGIRTTVFFKGCPLKCVWCHNPEGIGFNPQLSYLPHKCIGCGACVEACLNKALKLYGKEMTIEALMPILLEDKDFYETSGGGVTLSGGECLVQADFCAELLKELKKNHIHTAVDTCGFISKEAIDKVMPYTDVFLYDVKAVDEDVHIMCTGQSNKIILDNLRYIDKCGKAIEIRIPYVPEFNDEQIERIIDFLKEIQKQTKVRVLPYHNYASSKYDALGMENTLPSRVPDHEEILQAEELINQRLIFRHSANGRSLVKDTLMYI